MRQISLVSAGVLLTCVLSFKASDFKYHGCYWDFQANISYRNKTFISSENCIDFCVKHDFTFAGTSAETVRNIDWENVEGKCSCGNETADTMLEESHCNFTCPGNPDEMCGGKNESVYSMYMNNLDNKETESEHSFTGFLSGILVVGIIIIVVVCIVVVCIVVYKRRFAKHSFVPVSPGSTVIDNITDGQSKEEQSDPLQSGRNTLPNAYVDTEHSNSNIGELELYANTMSETNEDAGNHDDELNDVVYTNENQEQYENIIMMASAVVNENQNNSNEVAQDSVYKNVDELELLEYEIPIQSGMAEEHSEEDGEPGHEYEEMMPVKNVKKHVQK